MKMILVMALLGGQAAMAATSDTTTAMHDCDCLTDDACEVATMEQATKTMTNGPQVCEQCGGVNMAPSTKPGVDRWCFECGAIRATDFARAAYESYATSTGGKTIDGREMPAYFDLPQIRAAWEAGWLASQADMLADDWFVVT